MVLVRRTPGQGLSKRWDPFAELERLSERFEQLFEELVPIVPRRAVSRQDQYWTPAVDVYETDKSYMLELDLPGMTKDDITVTLEGTQLTLTGERKWAKDIKDDQVHRSERVYGKFVRSFQLPDNIDGDKVTAQFKDGVLKLEIPKAGKEKKKIVNIK